MTDRLGKILLFLFRYLFFVLPIYIIFLIAIQFYSISTDKIPSSEQYNLLFVAIGITATLSGLSFRAGSLCQKADKKVNFYHQGLRLLHCTMLFILSVPLSYIQNNIDFINKIALIGLINKYFNINNIISKLCFGFAQFFFTFGLWLALYAFVDLNRSLWREKLLDDKVKEEFFE